MDFDFTLGPDGQLTRYVERDGIKLTILSRLNPADAKSIPLRIDQGVAEGARRSPAG